MATPKWLKDRRQNVLSEEDVRTYLATIEAIQKTQELVQKIDTSIKKLGGLHRALNLGDKSTPI